MRCYRNCEVLIEREYATATFRLHPSVMSNVAQKKGTLFQAGQQLNTLIAAACGGVQTI